MARIALAPLIVASLALLSVSAPARADNLDGVYRGSFVCGKMAQAPEMLRAPFDMIVSGKTALFARPVFNRFGTRVVGSELATGTVDDSGAIKLTSHWSAGAFSYQGDYSGAINAKIGTLTGTQSWTTPRGSETRGCTVAFVQHSS
jgi:hypothetical protein